MGDCQYFPILPALEFEVEESHKLTSVLEVPCGYSVESSDWTSSSGF